MDNYEKLATDYTDETHYDGFANIHYLFAMKSSTRYLLLIFLNTLGMFLFYSPITLRGYYTDALLLLITTGSSFYFLWPVRTSISGRIIKVISYFNGLILISSLTLFHGLTPVKVIPKGKDGGKDVYSYFLSRGNMGATGACYGTVQFHKSIQWLRMLEVKVDTQECADLDYVTIINGY